MKRLNKSDLIRAIAAKRGMPQKDVQTVVDDLLGIIASSPEMDTTISFSGFGVFAPRHRKACQARNPATGAVVDVPATTTLKFRPATRKPGGK